MTTTVSETITSTASYPISTASDTTTTVVLSAWAEKRGVLTSPPETNSGIVTAWIPLTTTASSAFYACWNESYIDISDASDGADFVAFDPQVTVVNGVNTPVACQPTQVTSWFDSRFATSAEGELGTVTSIQPIVCPRGWFTAKSITVRNSEQVMCCPTGYTYNPTADYGIEANCASQIAPRQTFGNIDPYNSSLLVYAAVTTAVDVAAVAVKGYNLIGEPSPKKLNGGAIAGIVIGVLAAMALIGAGIFFLRRRRRRQQHPATANINEEDTKTSDPKSGQYVNVPQNPDHHLSELPTVSNTPELYTDYNPHSPRRDDAEIHELQ